MSEGRGRLLVNGRCAGCGRESSDCENRPSCWSWTFDITCGVRDVVESASALTFDAKKIGTLLHPEAPGPRNRHERRAEAARARRR